MPTSPRAPARLTEGATLIVSLLFVMLLLAVIMSVTAQITLSARRSSVDQQALLSARYAAESGVARVQARLKVMKALLDDAKIPPTVRNSEVDARISALCGGSPLPAPSPQATPVCTFPPAGLRDGGANPRVALFLQAVDAQTFTEQGFQHVSDTTRANFWADMFSGQTGVQYGGLNGPDSQYRTDFGLVPTRLERQGNSYRLFFEVPSAASEGTVGATTQRLSARATSGGRGEYYLLISRPPFARFALLTNHHFQSPQAEANGTRINFTSRTLFSGPVHTNQQFLFHEQPIFWGEVTSAGCSQNGIGTDPVTGKATCQNGATQPGAFFGATQQQFLCFKKDAADASCNAGNMASQPAPNEVSSVNAPAFGTNTPKFNASVKWDADYIRLPTNSRSQQDDATEAGLALNGDVETMQLQRLVVLGQERQGVTYTQGGITVKLSYGEDRVLYIQNAAGQWVPAGRDAAGNIGPQGSAFSIVRSFNGVISVADGGIANLNGGPNAAQGGPAGASIAAFAGVTVAATLDINVTSSLKYTDPPCTGFNTETAQAPCDNLNARNILGIYASGKMNADGSKVPANINLISPKSCPDGDGGCPNIGTDPQIHAVLMASQGAVQVDGWDRGAADNSLKKVNLLGGVIEDYYGAFGTVGGTGYGRNFVYDKRTYDGYSPPSFPTQEDWAIGLRLKTDDAQLVNTGKGIRLQGDAVSAGQGSQ